jgi:hypothetical protein
MCLIDNIGPNTSTGWFTAAAAVLLLSHALFHSMRHCRSTASSCLCAAAAGCCKLLTLALGRSITSVASPARTYFRLSAGACTTNNAPAAAATAAAEAEAAAAAAAEPTM